MTFWNRTGNENTASSSSFRLQWTNVSSCSTQYINSVILHHIIPNHHNNVWHPESLYGVLSYQLSSKVNGGTPGSSGQRPTGKRPHNPATRFHPPTTTVVSLEPFPSVPVKGTAGTVERWTLICAPVMRPKQCPTSSNSNPALLPSEWWSVPASLCRCCCYYLVDQLLILIAYARRRMNDIYWSLSIKFSKPSNSSCSQLSIKCIGLQHFVYIKQTTHIFPCPHIATFKS